MLNTCMKVYWIKHKEHNDIMTQGYVGITVTEGRGNRIQGHFNKLRNKSHPNSHLQNVYNLYKELEVDIVFEGTEEECIAKEIELRPIKEIGWNILEGGGMPPNHSEKHWFTNGKDNMLTEDCPIGFRLGKTQVSGDQHGHYSKPKKYKTVQIHSFAEGNIPWNKGIVGDKKEQIVCPYCNKKGGKPSMTRWHFDNCKEKK